MTAKSNTTDQDTANEDTSKANIHNDYITLNLNTSTFTYLDYLETAEKLHELSKLHDQDMITAVELTVEMFEFLNKFEKGGISE